jgi:hypothetical protein
MQCETGWRLVLASLDGRYEKLIADNQDAKKIDRVRASIFKIGQLVQSSLKVNGNGAKWKQRTELKPTGTPQ